jgi:hypothetical protein
MCRFFLIYFITLSANVYSQKGFYLRPLVESKKWYANREQSFSVTTAQGFVVDIKSENLFTNSGADIGLCFGYRTKRHFFETGISQARTCTGIKYRIFNQFTNQNILSATPKEYFGGYYVSDESGSFSWAKIPVRMGVKIFGSDSVLSGRKLHWEGFWYFGFDYLFGTRLTNGSNDENRYTIDDQGHEISVYTEYKTTNTLKRTLLGNTGFMIKTYTKKGHSLLNISLDFAQSLQPNRIIDQTKIVVANYDGRSYSHNIKSSGSSLTLTLSTELYPKNWSKKKNN